MDPASLAQAARAGGVPLRVYAPGEPRLRDLYASQAALIRPDGDVAWRGDRLPADPGALLCGARGRGQ